MAEVKVRDNSFVVCCNRAKEETMCGDIYAKFWIPETAWPLHEDYSKQVTDKDDLLTGMRFRFFNESIQSFFRENPEGVLVNLASGFSSYSQIHHTHRVIEVDCDSVINEKMDIAKKLESKSLIPKAKTEYIKCNFEDENSLLELDKKLKSSINGLPTYFLLEGILYYLREKSIRNLFSLAGKHQTKESLMGLSAWRKETVLKTVFKRYLEFYEEKFGVKSDEFQFMDDRFFEGLKDYQVLSKTGYPELSASYKTGFYFTEDDDEIFTEDLYLLRRV